MNNEILCTPRITGVVLTCNGERLIEKCLQSLSFCDTILVVDSGSEDETLTIAAAFKATIFERKWEGFASQFIFAQTQVQTDWFFILDQDEICPQGLGQKIIAAVELATENLNAQQASPIAFSVGRKSWYFDRFLKHSGWYPDHILRVFRHNHVEFYQDAHIHYKPLGATAHVGEVGNELIHYPYTSFFHQFAKLNVYAEQGAVALQEQGKKGGVFAGIVHGLGRFIRLYFLKKGFLDGRAGFIVAMHGAFYAFIKYVRVLESSWGVPFDKH